MNKIRIGIAFILAACLTAFLWSAGEDRHMTKSEPTSKFDGYSGSVSCRECHERFYKLWAPSYHGLAMQPFSSKFAESQIEPQIEKIKIGKRSYRAEIETGKGWISEIGPDGKKKYPIEHVLGGKNVYYFLTPLARGRLQVLPVAYDVRKKEWFDTTASAMRHFTDRTDEALDWKERQLTFNTSCYSCHVSQLSTNYDLATDTYHTVWAEPGINCETCHGPSGEHVRVCRKSLKGHVPKDLKIIRPKKFSAEKRNAMCAPCHAKMVPLTTTFTPGDRFFDHFDLYTLEHPDFYPDGRDLGENYTYTLWLTSPCVKSGKLDCLHCHTPSGRYKFESNQTNNACMPCHERYVKNAAAHSHHKTAGDGNKCVSCHMPMTEFARMQRTDHSMRSPTPATTILYKSPNACTLCHKDRNAVWADKWVRKWWPGDYQTPVLRRADLIETARKRDWSKLPEMISYLRSENHEEILAASLIRLLGACDSEEKWPVIIGLLKDPSPLVRASAAGALTGHLTPESVAALLDATRDDYRLVRIRSAAVLASLPPGQLDEQVRKDLEHATAEFETSMKSRPDDFNSHYNLGNFYMNRRDYEKAVISFETAITLQPDSVEPLVNVSLVYNVTGKNDKAEKKLRRAIEIEPDNLAANLNLGLLLGELDRLDEAETCLRKAVKIDPNSTAAAYNLSIILAKDRVEEAIYWCRKVNELRPEKHRYAYTLAFYLRKKDDVKGAIQTLKTIVEQKTAYVSAYLFLGEIYKEQGRTGDAIEVYRRAMNNEKLSLRERYDFVARIKAMSSDRSIGN
jgi:tetratricopeptide (TPR) repeat protein